MQRGILLATDLLLSKMQSLLTYAAPMTPLAPSISTFLSTLTITGKNKTSWPWATGQTRAFAFRSIMPDWAE